MHFCMQVRVQRAKISINDKTPKRDCIQEISMPYNFYNLFLCNNRNNNLIYKALLDKLSYYNCKTHNIKHKYDLKYIRQSE